jgi:Uma2 family endonuclease
MFVTTDRLGLIRGNHLHGPPDLAVEVVSASSRTRDTLHKRGEYEQAGVREYWLIDPDARQASFLVLADGRLEPGPMQDGAFHSRVLPEAWIQPGWLFQTPMPKPLDVLRRWGVI